MLLAVAGDVDDALAAEAEAEAIIADLGSEFYFGGFGLVAETSSGSSVASSARSSCSGGPTQFRTGR